MNDGRSSAAVRTGPRILLSVEDDAWGTLLSRPADEMVREAVFAAAAGVGLGSDVETEVSVTLSDDEDVRALNAEWRGKDKSTNILSFPMMPLRPGDAPGPMLGDLILARQTLEREARDEAKSPDDHFRHLLVHGVLHLLGYDHESEPEADEMEALEIAILAGLGIADPYADADHSADALT
ncbi:rRNA maturation RNase YbeY [Aureimonas phyllosphaerae]|uniref:Endoribonuclease YbeY n=1 Tax=Aureimonas phyllosphaerae TaxID=1166078 RepID=A0A7W6BT13_9HYPH|nr:rRNA maturation RNase YbeY [Aureimonas phyllosphaerae]MBB3937476.1 putative rRNA maturation factor [Aureimonas phyllosphaerae]MBB3961458.1 putative rRNA maturation factor [Aureimonas phyllosphaerae]SFF38364.1 probable rRNA maturation factor [Aureimonas phyllosphaerae]